MALGAHATGLASLAFGGLVSGPLQWLQAAQYELALFAGFWFVVGMIDELAIDCA